MKLKPKLEYNGVKVDSQEEMWFMMWLIEAAKWNLVESYFYHPEPFLLSSANKELHLSKITYQPDFKIIFTRVQAIRFERKFPGVLYFDYVREYQKWDGLTVFVDVKGTFARMGNVSASTFRIKQSWIMQKDGIFINKLCPANTMMKDKSKPGQTKIKELGYFAKTWVPLECAFGVRNPHEIRTCFKGAKLADEVLKAEKMEVLSTAF